MKGLPTPTPQNINTIPLVADDTVLNDPTRSGHIKKIMLIVEKGKTSGFSFKNIMAHSRRSEVLRDLSSYRQTIAQEKSRSREKISELELRCKTFESQMASEDGKSVLNYFEYKKDPLGNYLDDQDNIIDISKDRDKRVVTGFKRGMFGAEKIDGKAFDPDDPGSPFDKLKDYIVYEKTPSGQIKIGKNGKPIIDEGKTKRGIETELSNQIADTESKQAQINQYAADMVENNDLEKFYRDQNETLGELSPYEDHKDKITVYEDKLAEIAGDADQSGKIKIKQDTISYLTQVRTTIADQYDPQRQSLHKEKEIILNKYNSNNSDSELKYLLKDVNSRIDSLTEKINNRKSEIDKDIQKINEEIAITTGEQSSAIKKIEYYNKFIKSLESDLKIYDKEKEQVNSQRAFLKKKISEEKSTLDTQTQSAIKSDPTIMDLESKISKRKYDIDNSSSINIQDQLADDEEYNELKEVFERMVELNNQIKQKEDEIQNLITLKSGKVSEYDQINKNLKKTKYRFQFKVDKVKDVLEIDTKIASLEGESRALNNSLHDLEYSNSTFSNLKEEIADKKNEITNKITESKYQQSTNYISDTEITDLNQQLEERRAEILQNKHKSKININDRKDEVEIEKVALSNGYVGSAGYISHPNTMDDIMESNRKKIEFHINEKGRKGNLKAQVEGEYKAAKEKENLIRARYDKTFFKQYNGKDKDKVKTAQENLWQVAEQLSHQKTKLAGLQSIMSDTIVPAKLDEEGNITQSPTIDPYGSHGYLMEEIYRLSSRVKSDSISGAAKQIRSGGTTKQLVQNFMDMDKQSINTNPPTGY